MKYEACIRNLTYGQAQALYRMMVDLGDDEPMIGSEGATWSGIIPSNNSRAGRRCGIMEDRIITIQPMRNEQ